MSTSYAELLMAEDPRLSGQQRQSLTDPVEVPALTEPPGFRDQMQELGRRRDELTGEVAKGAGRSALSLLETLPQSQALLAGATRRAFEQFTGVSQPPTPIEEAAKEGHERIKDFTSGEGFLAPAVQDRIWAWDDPKWWAGQAGEALAYLAAVAGTGGVAGAGAAGAGATPAVVKTVQASMAAATGAILETHQSIPELRDALMQRGLTEQEATQFAVPVAGVAGAVIGVLDAIPINRMLRGMPGGRAGVMKWLGDIAFESGTEQLQELVSFGGEALLDVEDPSTLVERVGAAGTIGAGVGGIASPTISALQTRAHQADAVREVAEGPLRQTLDEMTPQERSELSTVLQQMTTGGRDAATDTPQDADDIAMAEAVAADVQRQAAAEAAQEAPAEEAEAPEVPAVDPAETIDDPQSPGAQTVRRGMANLGAVTGPLRVGAELTKGVANVVWLDMADRLENKGGDQSKAAAVSARKAMDETKATLGRMAEPLREAQKITGSISHAKPVVQLQRDEWVPRGGYATSRLTDALEGRIQNLTAGEQRVVEAIRDLVEARGKEFERAQLQQYDYASEQWVDFQVRGREIMPRILHAEGMDVIRKGSGAAFTRLVNAIAELNNVAPADVRKSLSQMSADMKGTGERATFGRAQAELQRVYPQMPSAIQAEGDIFRVLETNPHRYVTRLTEMGANRVGFVSQFGQSIEGDTRLRDARKAVETEGGDVKAFDDLMRVLNGMPVEEPLIEPGTATAAAARLARHLLSLQKAGLMTMSVVPNLFEMMGAPATFIGTTPLLKATYEVARHPVQLPATLRALGAISPNIKNLSFDPNRPFESITRFLREALGRGIPRVQLEELQELMGAAMAHDRVQAMQQGNGKANDILMIRQMMKWSIPDARRIASGQGTQAEYDAIVRRAPAFLTAGSIRAGEQSRANQNRIWKANIAFTRYFEARMRSNIRLWQVSVDAAKSGDPKLMYAAATQWARFLAGTTAQGAISALMLSFLFGGTLGFKTKLQEAKDDPLEFFGKSFLYSWFGGPWGQIVRVLSERSGGTPLTEEVLRMSMIGFSLDEIFRALSRTGSYRNKTWGEVGGSFFQRMLPVSRLEGSAMALATFGEKDIKRETAVSAYWRWRFDEKPPGRTTQQAVSQDRQRFRTKMAQAYRAFKRGEAPDPFLMEALQITDVTEKDVRASLRRRRLLATLKDQEQLALRNRVGDDAYEQLVLHDAALDGWARSFQKSKRLK